MKKLVLFFAIMSSFFAKAQDLKPIKWNYQYNKTTDGPVVVLHSKMDKGWHIFSNKPGGDDLAIPTEITITYLDEKGVKQTVNITDRQANVKPVSHKIEGFGTVSYYENEVSYKINISKYNTTALDVNITYQACNDKMCLPPTDVNFKIKL
jgi:DsbC/DsbD-like thiol-disulfide interchange protein